ncbi:NUDIX domain-containing protein [Sporosarcina thermotolerans]|uniref:NUDIX hydrolase n=1 Tax=Sporosarcina thermotolerans TaxID=633404 RepID=UPI0024BCE58A|nr:NUDIX domain-containing protein [Sporosarcina thermotolerans]WHT49023.1 NUDIX domain-containing protein [Sporosarcina thermotolerans]
MVHTRIRGSAVIIEDDKVGIIRRNRDGEEYYVFPGGGVEDGESPEEATVREAMEELGVQIEIQKLIGTVNFNGTQHFFLATIVGGTFGTGKGEEYGIDRNRGTYTPVWIPIDGLEMLDVRPVEIVKRLIK